MAGNSTVIARRSLFAAVPVAAAAVVIAPRVLAAPASPAAQGVTLRPGRSATLAFPVSSAGYSVSATVRGNGNSFFPWVKAHVSWSGAGTPRAWSLAGAPKGQRYTGTGPADGTMTVRLVSEDHDYPLHVALTVTGAAGTGADQWEQVTDYAFGGYPAARSDVKTGLIAAASGSAAPSDEGTWIVPLRNGAAKVTGSASGSRGQILLSSLAPDASPDPFWSADVAAGKSVSAMVNLPGSPCLLTWWNDGYSRAGRYSARITAA
jgi:hypothetical protein